MTKQNKSNNALCVIAVNGADASTFLQTQTTGDVQQVSEDKALFTSICNTKGRMVASFLLAKESSECFLLICHDSVSDTLVKHLNKYLVFSKADATLRNDLAIELVETAGSDEAFSCKSDDNGLLIQHPTAGLAWQLLNHTEANTIANSDADIAAELYFTTQEDSEKLLPQLINLTAFDGISFTKGCYIGQEIIARMKYLGQQKKQLLKLDYQGELTEQPTKLIIDGAAYGQILTVGSKQLLAIVKVDDVEFLTSTQINL